MVLPVHSFNVHDVTIPVGEAQLSGDLTLVPNALGLVIFAHGSGSSRFSERNRNVARSLNHSGFASLLFDLLTDEEEIEDRITTAYRFDIPMLARRLEDVVQWTSRQDELAALPIGCFGASTGAAAALVAAANLPKLVRAVVSRGGRPDLAGDALERVGAPVLLIVGGADASEVLELNKEAHEHLQHCRLDVVPYAGHLFEEHGKLEQVADMSAQWFQRHLPPFLAGQEQEARRHGTPPPPGSV